MKMFNKIIITFMAVFAFATTAKADFDELQYFIPYSQDGINVFESPKGDQPYEGNKVLVGGAFALQLQGLSHSNDADNLIELGSDFNLPTANMGIDAQLADGVRVNLEVYLASNHHHEAWVKGGYLQIDKLDFISKGFLEELMKSITIKVGQMENNYGDAHFRRSDNGNALKNPFAGNLILDAFITEVGAEVYYKSNGIIAMLGFSNAKLNQGVTKPNSTTPAILVKLGYDNNITKDVRFRLTGSLYHTAQASRIYLYSGDRTGSRFYNVIQTVDQENADFRAGRYAPKFSENITAIMLNNLITFSGLELFTTYEMTSDDNLSWSQFATELLYRFGSRNQFYAGGKYNMASGDDATAMEEKVSIDRIEAGLGWFLTKNVLAKLMFVSQNYNDFDAASKYAGAKFDGFMIESVIAF